MLDPYFKWTHFKVTFGPGLSEMQQESLSGCWEVTLMALDGSYEKCKGQGLPTHIPAPPLRQPHCPVGWGWNTNLLSEHWVSLCFETTLGCIFSSNRTKCRHSMAFSYLQEQAEAQSPRLSPLASPDLVSHSCRCWSALTSPKQAPEVSLHLRMNPFWPWPLSGHSYSTTHWPHCVCEHKHNL